MSEARRMLPRAAVLLLFAAAAASATVPGSPVRSWITELASSRDAAAPEARGEQTIAAAPAASRVESGVFVEVAEGRVSVILRDAKDLRVRATLVDGTRAGVVAAGDAAAGAFETGAGRIEVSNARDGEVRVEIPRGATTASVIINGSTVLRRVAGGLDLSDESASLHAAGVDFTVDF